MTASAAGNAAAEAASITPAEGSSASADAPITGTASAQESSSILPFVGALVQLAHLVRPLAAVAAGAVLWLKLVRVVAASVLLPSSLIGAAQRQQLDQMTRTAVEGGLARHLLIGHLDACILNESAATDGWMIYCNANGVLYEQIIPDVHQLAKTFNRKAIVFNYRGVSASLGGMASRGRDLVDDVDTVLSYVVKTLGARPERVLLWGHSIGGGAAIIAASRARHPGPVFSDRSFSKLSLVVAEKLTEGPIASLVSGLLFASMVANVSLISALGFGSTPWPNAADLGESAKTFEMARLVLSAMSAARMAMVLGAAKTPLRPALLGGCLQVLLGGVFESFECARAASIPTVVIVACAVGLELGARGRMDEPLLRLVNFLGWEMDAGKAWETLKGAKACSYHARDEMISLHSSLSVVAKASGSTAVELFGGNANPQNRGLPVAHMYGLQQSDLEGSILRFAKA